VTAAAGAWLDVRTSAAVTGRFVAVERDLHRRLGALAASARPPAVRCYLAEASLSHAWRACLFEALLPVSVGLPRAEEVVVLPAADLVRLSRLDDAEAPVDLLLDEIYPAIAESYEATAAAVPAVSDGPLALAARRAAADLQVLLARGVRVRA
jgi:hypothetical protein